MAHNNGSWEEWDLRDQICRAGRRLYDLFMVTSNDGNISVRLNEKELLITPSGVSKGFMRAEEMVKITLDGEIISAKQHMKPSSEHKMHLAIYQLRPDVRAVVHAHPPTATGFAVAGVALDRPFLPEVVVRTGPTPLVPYAIPGGNELPEAMAPFITDHDTLLMGNHGVVAYGKTITEALYNVETIELNARIFLTAHQLGNVNYLSDEQIVALQQRYGVKNSAYS